VHFITYIFPYLVSFTSRSSITYFPYDTPVCWCTEMLCRWTRLYLSVSASQMEIFFLNYNSWTTKTERVTQQSNSQCYYRSLNESGFPRMRRAPRWNDSKRVEGTGVGNPPMAREHYRGKSTAVQFYARKESELAWGQIRDYPEHRECLALNAD
jgi:hypothetical protein